LIICLKGRTGVTVDFGGEGADGVAIAQCAGISGAAGNKAAVSAVVAVAVTVS